MIPVMNNLNGVISAKSDVKSSNKKILDFKNIIKDVQKENSDEGFNSNKEVIDDKRLINIINLILNLISNNLNNGKGESQANLQALKENIIDQLYNAMHNGQGTGTFNLKNIVNTVAQMLYKEFGLNIDPKDVLHLLQNRKANDLNILSNSSVANIIQNSNDTNISSNKIESKDGTKQQVADGKGIMTDVLNDKKSVNINNLDINLDNNPKDENLNQNDNKDEIADKFMTDKNQGISKRDENKSNLSNNKIIDLKSDNIVILGDNQSGQLAANTDKYVNMEGAIQKTDIQNTDIINQIVKNVNITKSDIESTIRIQLKPDFLGKIEIDIKSADGSLTANILTDNEKVKHQIEANINMLNSQLESKGIKIDSFNVSIDKNMQFTSQYNGQEGGGERYRNQNQNTMKFKYDDDYESQELESHIYTAVNTASSDHVDVIV